MPRMFFGLTLTICLLGMLSPVTGRGNRKGGVDTLRGADLAYYGRCLTENGRIELIGSAAHAGFSFTGKECAVHITGVGYIQYEIDGIYQKRVKIGDEVGIGIPQKPYVITTPKAGKHTIWIYKTTEAASGPVYIKMITGRGLKLLKKTSAPLIEFIGNSITCGAQADVSEFPCGVAGYADHHNAYYAYGPRVARELGVQYFLSSVSGIGIYRNWNSDGPTMPQVYEKADLKAGSQRPWDFSQQRPSIVSIALGTNDLSHGDGVHPRLAFDTVTFVNTYVKFVELVKTKYPTAQIALLSSPMEHGKEGLMLQRCLTAVKKRIDASHATGKRVALFFFQPMQARGCGGHPSVEDHAVLANELVPFFKALL